MLMCFQEDLVEIIEIDEGTSNESSASSVTKPTNNIVDDSEEEEEEEKSEIDETTVVILNSCCGKVIETNLFWIVLQTKDTNEAINLIKVTTDNCEGKSVDVATVISLILQQFESDYKI